MSNNFCGQPSPDGQTICGYIPNHKGEHAFESRLVTPDTSLRADMATAIAKFVPNQLIRERNAEYWETLIELERIMEAALTAERTAIKAALPEKQWQKAYEDGNTSGIPDKVRGYNKALTEVTQVIDNLAQAKTTSHGAIAHPEGGGGGSRGDGRQG